MALSILSLVK